MQRSLPSPPLGRFFESLVLPFSVFASHDCVRAHHAQLYRSGTFTAACYITCSYRWLYSTDFFSRFAVLVLTATTTAAAAVPSKITPTAAPAPVPAFAPPYLLLGLLFSPPALYHLVAHSRAPIAALCHFAADFVAACAPRRILAAVPAAASVALVRRCTISFFVRNQTLLRRDPMPALSSAFWGMDEDSEISRLRVIVH